MKKYVIIVAGGKGLRMGGEVPKQFLPIGGKPVLMRTVEVFYQTDAETGIVLVLPQEQQSYWKNLCCQYDFRIPYILADGGCTRFHSVRNGLQVIPDEDSDSLIAVHDGVRPFVSPRVIQECFEAATRWRAVVPVLDMVDSVRQLSEDGSSMAVDRSCLKLVQTPQTFRADILKNAYRQEFTERFTDDASVVEASGVSVALVSGNRENIKITTPFDLKIAEVLLKE
ncbi:MAG: 2-C-methyl-D-erythritol 4-phosphate cytidylyltransferase [Candidatus Paraprevotella stercoravium]|uniref:2-C-methyl-D-erythritol 4-phosphate cytidylyltransferase n=1 Tax=Candidatus Paraprevotella stercoravium TaxID=2838725 RepID=A0A9E2L6C4_9BACT|nr:2-C-methyl-D-erythritol 4-phosphate cytidylyltransferase [Candidatus Paraprevotella stercoravium]